MILFFLAPEHAPSYAKLLFVLILLAFNGLVLFAILSKTNNKLLLIGGGMIYGVCVFLLILSIFSYFFKGPTAILYLFVIYVLVCSIIFVREYNSTFRKLFFKTNLDYKSKVFGLVIFSYLFFIFFTAGGAVTGGDVITYWGIATSFARGNYPAVLPWQPNFLTVYHMGAFILQGAIRSLSSINISIVHFFFSAYAVSAVFLFITGIARERTRSFASLIPAVFGLVLFGGPVFLIGGLGSFVSELLGHTSNSMHGIVESLSSLPQFSGAKGSAGAGANSLGGLMYINYQTLGLASFFLFLYFLRAKSIKDTLRKYIHLVILIIITLSIDETYFLIEAPILALAFLVEYKKLTIKKFIYHLTILATIFSCLFLVVQNPVRDAFFVPSKESPRFKLITWKDSEFAARRNFSKAKKFLPEMYKNTEWYLPSLPLLIIFALVFGFWSRSWWAIITSSGAILSYLYAFAIVNTFWPANGLRLITKSYNLIMFALGFFMTFLYIWSKKRKGRFKFLIFTVFLLILTPQLVTAHAGLINFSVYKKQDNLTRNINYQNKTLNWIQDNLPYGSRVIFIDEYPLSGLYSPLSLNAIQYHGIFVPTAPPKVKVLNRDKGGGWYDSVVSLSPPALEKLGVEYVFIKYTSLGRFSEDRQKQINDPIFFKSVYENNSGKLYEVSSNYLSLPDNDMTLGRMISVIPNAAKVYIDKLYLPTPRKTLILELAKHTQLYGPMYAIGGDYYMYIETLSPFKAVSSPDELQDVDYIFTKPESDPISIFKNRFKFENIGEIPHVSLWKRVNE